MTPTTMRRLEMPGYRMQNSWDRVELGGIRLSPESVYRDSAHRSEMW